MRPFFAGFEKVATGVPTFNPLRAAKAVAGRALAKPVRAAKIFGAGAAAGVAGHAAAQSLRQPSMSPMQGQPVYS